MKYFRGGRIWLIAVLALGLAGRGRAADEIPRATNLWSFKLGHIGCQATPALAPDGTIYQATVDGLLLAFMPAGNLRWQFATKTELEIKSSPAIGEDGTIYFGARDRKFYAVTPAGKLRWVFATGAWVDSSPAIATDGTIYFGGWDKKFYALKPDGTPKWVYPVRSIVVSSPAIAGNGTIYFGAFDRNLYALTDAGKLKWRFATGGEIASSPAIGPEGSVYFTSMDGNLYALRPDGTERWQYHTGSHSEGSPVLDEQGNVYVPGSTGEYQVNQEGQGHVISGLACPVEVAAAAVKGRIYWSRPWRSLQAFQADGELLWQAETDANLTSSPVVGTDGVVYFTAERYLYAVQPAGPGLPPASTSWPMFRANAQHTGRVGNKPQNPGPGGH